MGMGPLALGVQAAGAGVSAMGAYNGAVAQKNALTSQAQVDTNNAQIASWQEQQAVQDGQVNEENEELKTAATYGTQRADLAANGVDLGQGSASTILATTKFMGARDATQIQNNALRNAWGYAVESTDFKNQAAGATAGADSINPLMSGAGSLLTGASSVAKSWYSAKSAGVAGF